MRKTRGLIGRSRSHPNAGSVEAAAGVRSSSTGSAEVVAGRSKQQQ